MITGRGIVHSYEYEGSPRRSLRGVDIDVADGEFVAILGHNGCGKSTLAKHLNGLLPLQRGTLTVAGMDVSDRKNLRQLRRTVGMVFQNPDNQFVSSVVEEDIAFGLENYETPRAEIPERVKAALEAVGMSGYEKKSPHNLSGGQKQRVALAGVLALDPQILVFDEVTAMLDPKGREEILAAIRQLHDEQHKTVIMISHYIEEAVFADRVYLMHDGVMLANGTPREMLTDLDLLASTGLYPPACVKVYYDLKKEGIELQRCPLTNEELGEELCRLQ